MLCVQCGFPVEGVNRVIAQPAAPAAPPTAEGTPRIPAQNITETFLLRPGSRGSQGLPTPREASNRNRALARIEGAAAALPDGSDRDKYTFHARISQSHQPLRHVDCIRRDIRTHFPSKSTHTQTLVKVYVRTRIQMNVFW